MGSVKDPAGDVKFGNRPGDLIQKGYEGPGNTVLRLKKKSERIQDLGPVTPGGPREKPIHSRKIKKDPK